MKAPLYASRGLLVTVVLALAICLNAEPPQAQQSTVPSAAHTGGQKLTIAGAKNFGEVTPTLYRGGQPSSEGYEALAKMGVNIVVDGRLSGHDSERKEVEKAGMQYVAIPWHCLFPRDEVMARFLAVLRANPGKKVFVHCRYGDDRTGMMIAAYRMSVEGWTAEEARREMDQYGFKPMVCPSLILYEKHFPEKVKKNSSLRAPASEEPAAKN
jgi:tyrosine-protein phosphatase SIW14